MYIHVRYVLRLMKEGKLKYFIVFLVCISVLIDFLDFQFFVGFKLGHHILHR